MNKVSSIGSPEVPRLQGSIYLKTFENVKALCFHRLREKITSLKKVSIYHLNNRDQVINQIENALFFWHKMKKDHLKSHQCSCTFTTEIIIRLSRVKILLHQFSTKAFPKQMVISPQFSKEAPCKWTWNVSTLKRNSWSQFTRPALGIFHRASGRK